MESCIVFVCVGRYASTSYFFLQIGDIMKASEQEVLRAKSYIVQASPDTFDHAAWLSAIHSEVISVNEETQRLRIFPITDCLRRQFEKLGASVSHFPQTI